MSQVTTDGAFPAPPPGQPMPPGQPTPPDQSMAPGPATTPAREHVAALMGALTVLDTRRLDSWGERLAQVLGRGGRVLTAGNGGSAAHAQHLAAEFTGKFGADRAPYSAIALPAESSTVTAIANDYGYDEVYARQVLAHGRPGDVLIALSTSGRSRNLIRAAEAARMSGLATWALTGPAPNPLSRVCDEAVCVTSTGAPALTATVQEAHQVALHLICLAFDTTISNSGVPNPGIPS